MNGSAAGHLYKDASKLVFGSGNPEADLMIIGEAPGHDEDITGEPFVGRSGDILNRMLKKANTKRSEVYITNIVKRRPPGNRDPIQEEIEISMPWLHAQVALIHPKTILSLGRIASNALLGLDQEPVAALRERRDLRFKNDKTGIDIPLVVTYHPAYVLRQLQYGPNTLYITFRDLRRAVKISTASFSPLPEKRGIA